METVMRRLVWAELSEPERVALCARGLAAIFDPALRASIAELIEDVRVRGDAAVCDALARFDGVDVEPAGLRVGPEEIASADVSSDVDAALDDAIAHCRAFNDEVMERAVGWEFEAEPGLQVGEKVTPITSAGLFVPSGKASYPSVAYQLGVPARVAGVPHVVLVVPPAPGASGRVGGRAGGTVDPAVLVVCRKLGIADVFRVNGPAGIAALGFGTETIPRVRKIVGPGSPAVACTQVEMQRHGVATMMLLGPTESVVIADGSADPVRLAADLLIEAEHGTDSSVVLVTTSSSLAERTEVELTRQVADLPQVRADAARSSLGVNGGCVLVDDLDDAVAVANRYAPEHLQVAVADGDVDKVVDGLVNAGEILVGQHTPFSAANFVIGCPAALPTSGFAEVSSGITVEAFLKRTAIARADEHALARMTPSILALAEHEGFPAHAAALRRRR
jgi:histidinol dehydrogenase